MPIPKSRFEKAAKHLMANGAIYVCRLTDSPADLLAVFPDWTVLVAVATPQGARAAGKRLQLLTELLTYRLHADVLILYRNGNAMVRRVRLQGSSGTAGVSPPLP